MQDNQHQREIFKKKMSPVVDEIQYTVINQAAGRMDEEKFFKSTIKDFSVPNKTGVCANPFTRMVITWQGDISMCCIDFDLDMKIGTYKNGGLASVWSGLPAAEIRKNMLEKRTDSLPVICQNCDNLKYDAALRSKMINNVFR